MGAAQLGLKRGAHPKHPCPGAGDADCAAWIAPGLGLGVEKGFPRRKKLADLAQTPGHLGVDRQGVGESALVEVVVELAGGVPGTRVPAGTQIFSAQTRPNLVLRELGMGETFEPGLDPRFADAGLGVEPAHFKPHRAGTGDIRRVFSKESLSGWGGGTAL